MKLWEINDDGNMRKTLRGSSKWIYSCAWSPDAKMIVTTGDSRSVSNFPESLLATANTVRSKELLLLIQHTLYS